MNENANSAPQKLRDRLKKQAGEAAVDSVESGMVLGLGTGSTTRYALEELGRRIKSGDLRGIVGVPSSIQTGKIAAELGIDLTNFDEVQEIDITIDGADEVDPYLNLIKGGGGALLREKVLAQASRRNIIIVDESKLSPQLGTLRPVPVEVIPFACKVVERFLISLGGDVGLRMTDDGNPYTTDQENLIIDLKLGPITDPGGLASTLGSKAGIVEYGLFLGTASEVIVAGEAGIRLMRRKHA